MCGNLVLVTTSEALQDPPTAAVQAAYAACQACFRFVGPLLPAPQLDGLAERLRAHQGRRVAVSMGTVITGEDKVVGWRADCEGHSLTGQELCRAVWQGVFEACAAWIGSADRAGEGSRGDATYCREPLGPKRWTSHGHCTRASWNGIAMAMQVRQVSV